METARHELSNTIINITIMKPSVGAARWREVVSMQATSFLKLTIPKSAMVACAQVLSTYELLENLLLQLPLYDLLLAERVSKQFQAIIKRSKTIRQVLFREEISPNTTLV